MRKSEARSLITSIARVTKAFFARKSDVAALAARVEKLETQVKAIGPGLRYKGVWTDGSEYAAGDCVTHQGSVWIAHTATAQRPGDLNTAWQLAVRHGRDARR